MARNFVRPEISRPFLKELLGKRQILINPDWADIRQALALVQKGCRTNKLAEPVVRQAWSEFQGSRQESARAGGFRCPLNYGYEMEGTLFQAVHITPTLTGVLVGRERAYPGDTCAFPVTASSETPVAWRNQLITAFWTHLTDAEIEALYRDTVIRLLTAEEAFNQPGGTHERGYWARRQKLRALQLQQLFQGTEPGFVSEFSMALRTIATTLEALQISSVPWSQFKRQWPGFASRYQRDLLGLMQNARITLAGIRGYIDQNTTFGLSLDVWNGAQRLFSQPQIVFRLTAPAVFDALSRRNIRHQQLISRLMGMSENSLHPSTRHTVGWLRVHVDEMNQLIFIDEVQSDVMEWLWAEARARQCKAAAEIARALQDWLFHGYATVQHWSHSIGYRLAMHSKASAARKAPQGMTTSERKWNVYYQSLINRHGLVERQVKGYPAPIRVEAG